MEAHWFCKPEEADRNCHGPMKNLGFEMVNKQKFIENFVQVMKNNEYRLSDGFKFYKSCDDEDEIAVEKELTNIAEELWNLSFVTLE